MSKYDVNAIRNQVQKKIGSGRDPAEFRPAKAENDSKPITYRFYVLPPVEEGDKLISGPADKSMELFFLENGAHYIEGKRLGCPRVINDEDCPVCQFAFDCIKEIKERGLPKDEEKVEVRKISGTLLPASYRMVNIYFPDGKLGKANPEDLRGKVMWYNAPTTVFNQWWDCLQRDDDGGDELNPQPFGVFFDEEDSYLYTLGVVKKGLGNNYEKSDFVVKENFKSHPIARLKDGTVDPKVVADILSRRHDLYSKLPEVKNEELKRIHANLSGDEYETEEETKPDPAPAKTSKPAKTETKTKKKGGLKPPVSESSDELSLDDDDDLDLGSDTTGDAISDEVPVDDTPAAAAAPAADASEGDDDEIENLLGQLTDND